MSSIVIRDITYSIGKVDAFTQLFLSRKSIPFFIKWTKKDGMSFDEALSEIPEEDMQEMFNRILPYITREVPGSGWFPIWNKSAKAFMYEDINGADLLKLLYFTLEIYLQPFIPDDTQKD